MKKIATVYYLLVLVFFCLGQQDFDRCYVSAGSHSATTNPSSISSLGSIKLSAINPTLFLRCFMHQLPAIVQNGISGFLNASNDMFNIVKGVKSVFEEKVL